MNNIVYLSSDDDDEDDKPLDPDSSEEILETSDEKEKPKSRKRKKPKSTLHRKSKLLGLTVENKDGDDDDDCVVLDGDPYMTTEKETAIDTFANDEVLILGQKGEIACRDFPHPRHACAKYPFHTTPHDKYCDMCHCYVCDIRAPCPYWRVLFSSIDHCHANNKEQTWKNQRESTRTGEMLPRPASTIPQLQHRPQSQYIRPTQNPWYPHSGMRACSVRPNSYIRPGYSTEQSRTVPQNLGLQPRGAGGSYNGNLRGVYPPVQSGGVYPPVNGKHNIAQGSQFNYNTPPMASQGNPQRIVNGYISTMAESYTKVFARQFNRNMYSGNVQASAVLSPANQQQQQQQQQSGRSSNKALSEFEDWLMNDIVPTGPVCPLLGQDSADTAFEFDFETFLK